MKTLTALLLASGMAVTMIPATATVAQEATSTSIQEMQLDGATLDQIAAATTAVAVYVSNTFDLEAAPANIADVRTAVDANAALSTFLDSREIDTPDIVGVALNGETNLVIFVALDPADENDMTGTMNADGMIDVDGDEMDMEDDNADTETDVEADAESDTEVDVNVDGDGMNVDAETDIEADVTAN